MIVSRKLFVAHVFLTVVVSCSLETDANDSGLEKNDDDGAGAVTEFVEILHQQQDDIHELKQAVKRLEGKLLQQRDPGMTLTETTVSTSKATGGTLVQSSFSASFQSVDCCVDYNQGDRIVFDVVDLNAEGIFQPNTSSVTCTMAGEWWFGFNVVLQAKDSGNHALALMKDRVVTATARMGMEAGQEMTLSTGLITTCKEGEEVYIEARNDVMVKPGEKQMYFYGAFLRSSVP